MTAASCRDGDQRRWTLGWTTVAKPAFLLLLVVTLPAMASPARAEAECEAPIVMVTDVTHSGCAAEHGQSSPCYSDPAACGCDLAFPAYPAQCTGGDGEDACQAPVMVVVGDCLAGSGGGGAGQAQGGFGGDACTGLIIVTSNGCVGGDAGTCQRDDDVPGSDKCGLGGDGCRAPVIVALDRSCRGGEGTDPGSSGTGCEGVLVVREEDSCTWCDDQGSQPEQCYDSCQGGGDLGFECVTIPDIFDVPDPPPPPPPPCLPPHCGDRDGASFPWLNLPTSDDVI